MNRPERIPLSIIAVACLVFILVLLEFNIAAAIVAVLILLFIRNSWWESKNDAPHYIDHRGYERDGWGDLVHRAVAYHHHYLGGNFELPFSMYDVHHKDRNKRNNNPDNLEILTREEHKKKHLLNI